MVFNDANGNGLLDGGESGIGGIVVTLTNGVDMTVTAMTSGDGSYSFSDVPAGDYTLHSATPSGFTPTTAAVQAISVAAGGSAGANFGFQQQGTLSGVVFRDANGNGVQDVGETGISGVTIDLSGPYPGTTTTERAASRI